jgi:hypothetical protein
MFFCDVLMINEHRFEVCCLNEVDFRSMVKSVSALGKIKEVESVPHGLESDGRSVNHNPTTYRS